MTKLTNAMTVDVEDYFQVSAFESILPSEKWSSMPIRVEHNTEQILKLFDDYSVKATFFILGWVAEKRPHLVRAIAKEGHEIASHGFGHKQLHTLSPQAFREDCLRSKSFLEDLISQRVLGYRAPTFSLSPKTPWAHPILEELGFQYSSSVHPILHDLYGWPDSPRFSYTATPNGLMEIPVTTLHKWGRPWPCGGGGYFRFFLYAYSRWAIKEINQTEQKPCVFYIHPWEIDPFQPKQNGLSFKTRFRHYHNLHKTKNRLEKHLKAFSWDTMQHVFIKTESKGQQVGNRAA